MTQPPPGWYPDPSGAPTNRYWDGSKWAPPPRRRVWPWVLLVVAVVFLGGCGAFALLVGTAVSHDRGPASMGAEVRDGKFAFVVQRVDTSNQLGTTKPRGTFVTVTMTVTNIGGQPQSFFVANQKLLDKAGRSFAADSMVALEMNSNGTSMLTDMNPGFTISVLVPFDVPLGTAPDVVELHDSAFSGGARVKL